MERLWKFVRSSFTLIEFLCTYWWHHLTELGSIFLMMEGICMLKGPFVSWRPRSKKREKVKSASNGNRKSFFFNREKMPETLIYNSLSLFASCNNDAISTSPLEEERIKEWMDEWKNEWIFMVFVFIGLSGYPVFFRLLLPKPTMFW